MRTFKFLDRNRRLPLKYILFPKYFTKESIKFQHEKLEYTISSIELV